MVVLGKTVNFVLAVFIFIILISLGGSQGSSPTGPIIAIKEFHANFTNHFVQPRPDFGQIWPVVKMTYPSQSWSSKYGIHSSFPERERQLDNEKLMMDKSNSEKSIEDFKAINCIKNRDIIYDDPQTNNDGNGNSVDIDIQVDNQKSVVDAFGADDTFETFMDPALESGFKKTYGQGTLCATKGYERLGNYMNIGVRGITVSAINTVPDGSAVANSNIIIKPIQLVVCPSEVEEKLK
jgi:hypothetical protein